LIKICGIGLISSKNFTDNFLIVKKEIRKYRNAINAEERKLY